MIGTYYSFRAGRRGDRHFHRSARALGPGEHGNGSGGGDERAAQIAARRLVIQIRGIVGFQVEQSLQQIHADTLFMGTDGLSIERGLTTGGVVPGGSDCGCEASFWFSLTIAGKRQVDDQR